MGQQAHTGHHSFTENEANTVCLVSLIVFFLDQKLCLFSPPLPPLPPSLPHPFFLHPTYLPTAYLPGVGTYLPYLVILGRVVGRVTLHPDP